MCCDKFTSEGLIGVICKCVSFLFSPWGSAESGATIPPTLKMLYFLIGKFNSI